MTIEVKRVDNGFQLQSSNGEEKISVGVHPKFQENTSGMRPMELLLSSLGSCLSIDLLNILYKQKIELDDFSVTLEGKREEEPPNAYKDIEIRVFCFGDVQISNVVIALEAVIDKYCSVFHSLNPSILFTVNLEFNDKEKVNLK